MKTILAAILRLVLHISFVKELMIHLDSRFNKKSAGVSDWLANLLPYKNLSRAPWAINTIPLKNSKIALITTGGLFVREMDAGEVIFRIDCFQQMFPSLDWPWQRRFRIIG